MHCRTQSEEAAAWEAGKEADSQRLKRHQRVLDKQSRALLKLPNRKERSEVTCLLQLQLKLHAVSADCITENYMSPKRKLAVQMCEEQVVYRLSAVTRQAPSPPAQDSI